jgi:hypothetical protein
VLLGTIACSLTPGTLGGRQTCWSDSVPRAASLWRGILRIDTLGGQLDTPEGDVIPLIPGTLQFHMSEEGGELVRGADVVARAGQDVTLFGGAGSDGALVVCAVEEVHQDASRGLSGAAGRQRIAVASRGGQPAPVADGVRYSSSAARPLGVSW